MLSINTNLSSLMLQASILDAALGLNNSVERLTTGFKVNHAKDNAANFGIITNMTTGIGSLEIAEDNAAMALDMLSTASSNLDLISSHLSRLRDLANISANGTYGQDSRDALQAELNSRLGEISRVLESGEYNNKTLFEENNGTQGISTYSSNDMSSTVVMTADKDTTFEDLGITDRVINVYNKNGSLTNTYTFDGLDTIGKFLDILKASGFSAKISNGVISVESSSGAYIAGSLADALGIETESSTVITSATSSSTLKVSYTETTTADAATTFAEVGLDMQGKTLDINSKDTNQKIATITIDSNSKTFDDLFNALEPYGIDGTINNGRITLNSASYYVTGEAANLLGIGTSSSSGTETSGSSVTSDSVLVYTSSVVADTTSKISDFITLDSNNKILLHNGSSTTTFTVTNTTTFDDMMSAFASAGINSSMNDGRISFSSSGGSYAEDLNPSGGVLQKLGITTTTISNTQTTSGISQTSGDAIKYTTEASATLSTRLMDLGITSTSFVVENTNGTALKTVQVSSTDTLQDLFNDFSANSITASLTDGVISLSGTNIISGDLAAELGITKSVIEGTDVTIPASGELLTEFTYVDASDCLDMTDISVTVLEAETTYQITSTDGLVKFAELVNSDKLENNVTVVLMNDIDLSSIKNWTPINVVSPDGLIFEGNGHTIKNMVITTKKDNQMVGLFGQMGGTIQNLRLLDANVIINNDVNSVGLLAGYVSSGLSGPTNTIFNCSTTGTIKLDSTIYPNVGVNDLGGLLGGAYGSDIEYCYSDVNFFATDEDEWYSGYMGGLIGYLRGNVKHSIASGSSNIDSFSNRFGGLLGAFEIDNIAANNITSFNGADYGLIGWTNTASIQDYYGIYNNTCLASSTKGTVNGAVDNIITVTSCFYKSVELGVYGISGTNYIVIHEEDSFSTITVTPTDTIDTIIDNLANFGIDLNLDIADEKWSITNSGTASISLISDELEDTLNLKNIQNGGTDDATFTVDVVVDVTDLSTTNFSNSSSNTLYASSTAAISTTTKLTELGFNTGAFELLEVNSNKNLYFTVNSTSTVGDIIEAINKQAGLNASLTNGMLTVAGSSSAYITDMNADFASIFKLAGAGDGKTYVSTGVVVQGNSDSDAQKTNVTQTAASGTTLGELGLTSNGVIKINDKNTGAKTINVNADTTIQELQNKLNGITVSFTNGRLTLAGSDSVWITSISQNLIDALNLPGAGKDITYTITSSTDYTNTPSNKTLQTQSTSTLAGDTKLSEIAGYANGNGKIALHRDNGTYVTLSLSATDTIQNFFNKIKAYGISASITDGRVTLESAGDIYLESISGGSNILSVLNIGNIQKVKETVTSNNESNKLTYNKVIQSDWRSYNFDTTFGVVGGNPNDTITLGFDFNLNFGLDISTQETAKSALEDLDKMLEQISLAQTHLGAAENRFTSILEDISIKYENLVSSRSTLRDTDIAEESSEYIRNQILLQAAATLLATANQSPAVALQLI